MNDRATTFSDSDRARLEAEWNRHPGIQFLGVRLDLSTAGVVRAVVDPVRPEHRGGMGTEAVNGILISGVFDLVVGLSGYLETLAVGRRAGVAQLNVQFLRPVLGDRFEVVGRPVRVGRSLIFATAELRDAQGVVCARCDGIAAAVGADPGTGPAI